MSLGSETWSPDTELSCMTAPGWAPQDAVAHSAAQDHMVVEKVNADVCLTCPTMDTDSDGP